MLPQTKSTLVYLLIAEMFFLCQLLLAIYPSYGVYASASSVILLFLFSLKRPSYSAIASCIGILIAIKMAAVTVSIEDPGVAAAVLYGMLGGAMLIFATIRSWPKILSGGPAHTSGSEIARMFMIGEILGLITWIVLPMDDPFRVLPRVALVFCAPFAAAVEEYVFRNSIQKEAHAAAGRTTGIFFTAWIAAAFSLSTDHIYMLLIITVNLVFAYLYSRTKSSSLTFFANLSMKLTFIALVAIRPLL